MDRFVYHETPGMIAYYGNHEYVIIKDTSASVCIGASYTNFLFKFIRDGDAWKLTRAWCGVGVHSLLYREYGQRRGEAAAAELLARVESIIHALGLPDNYTSDYIKKTKVYGDSVKFVLKSPDIMNDQLTCTASHVIVRPDLYVGAEAKMQLLKTLPQPIAEEIIEEFRFFGPTKYARLVAKLRRLYVVMTSADPDIIRTRPRYSRSKNAEERKQIEAHFNSWRADNYTFWFKTAFGWRRAVWWNHCVRYGGNWHVEAHFLRRARVMA